ncbi:MAG: class I SAM-dependent methyltransferase [Anaerolineae bacterium]|nr:class I SAM-dependent methyltransferase [Anaerolineae bacterium]
MPLFEAYYDLGQEQDRLLHGAGKLELIRTQEILQRYLPTSGTVIDVGGGAGVYALWLASLGYEVHLIDLMPLHVAQAAKFSQGQPPLASIAVGDARALPFDDQQADAVLLLGPLYHLIEREDRVQALREAYRVLRPGGVVIAAAISRFASLFSGVHRDFMADPVFQDIVRRDLQDGQHRNPTPNARYFTTAFFHYPTELGDEVQAAGFDWRTTLAVEGPAWLNADFDLHWEDAVKRETMLEFVRLIETEPAIMGASPHLIAIGHKPL